MCVCVCVSDSEPVIKAYNFGVDCNANKRMQTILHRSKSEIHKSKAKKSYLIITATTTAAAAAKAASAKENEHSFVRVYKRRSQMFAINVYISMNKKKLRTSMKKICRKKRKKL